MKYLSFPICALLFLIVSCNDEKTADTSSTKTDTTAMKDTTKSATYDMPDSATMMKNWQEYMTPSAPHKMMESWNGTWEGDVTMWSAPGAPPEQSKSTTVNKMVMGGRYQMSSHKGSMMGSPFEGMGTLAFDNAKKEFISTWIDNVGTGLMVARGPWDESSKTMTLKGRVTDPMTGKDVDMRETFKIVDDNNQVMEMYGTGPDGNEFKMMEIKFKRKS